MKIKQKIHWKATKKQEEALVRSEYEILFGGSRGGGKTDSGIAWLLYDKDNPKYRALVVRRNADDLSDWISRAKQIYEPTGAKFTGITPIITFPSGAIIKTGHLKDADAYTKYIGHNYQKILIEELTLIPNEESYLKLISSCRSTIPEIKPQVFATTNPGEVGHKWVKKRFKLFDVPDKPIITIDKETGRSRVFIPAKVEDNPYLMENDPDYVKFLDGLPDGLREQWRLGSWNDYEVKGAYYTNEINQAKKDNKISDVVHQADLLVHTVWDLGIGDMMSIIFFQLVGQKIHIINYYQNDSYGIPFYIRKLDEFRKDLGYKYGEHFFPHDIEVRELTTGKSRRETLENLDITVNVVPRLNLDDGINAVRLMFPKCWFDEEKTEELVDGLLQYKKQWNDKNQVYEKTPIHNWASHPADAFRYLAISYSNMTNTPIDKKPSEFNKFSREANGMIKLPQKISRFHYK